MDTFHPARIDDIEDNSKLRRGIPGEHVGCGRGWRVGGGGFRTKQRTRFARRGGECVMALTEMPSSLSLLVHGFPGLLLKCSSATSLFSISLNLLSSLLTYSY